MNPQVTLGKLEFYFRSMKVNGEGVKRLFFFNVIVWVKVSELGCRAEHHGRVY